jgi:hypothetical protein
MNSTSIFDNDEIIEVNERKEVEVLSKQTKESIYRDQHSARNNLIMSAFVAFLTTISISAGNTDMNLIVFFAIVSMLLAIQAITISGKSIGRFIRYGILNHKPIDLVYYSFVFSISMAYINGYAALKVLGFIETSWWS